MPGRLRDGSRRSPDWKAAISPRGQPSEVEFGDHALEGVGVVGLDVAEQGADADGGVGAALGDEAGGQGDQRVRALRFAPAGIAGGGRGWSGQGSVGHVRLFPGAPSDREARDRTKGEHMARGGSGRSTGRRVRAAIRRGRRAERRKARRN